MAIEPFFVHDPESDDDFHPDFVLHEGDVLKTTFSPEREYLSLTVEIEWKVLNVEERDDGRYDVTGYPKSTSAKVGGLD